MASEMTEFQPPSENAPVCHHAMKMAAVVERLGGSISEGKMRVCFESPVECTYNKLSPVDEKILTLLTPAQCQQVEFWPNRMSRLEAGIRGYFIDGRFWSHDKADFWMPSEVTNWHSVEPDGSVGRGCITVGDHE